MNLEVIPIIKEEPPHAQPFGQSLRNERGSMLLKWAAIFLIAAAAFSFTDTTTGDTEISKILFGSFFVMFVVALITGLLVAKFKQRLDRSCDKQVA